VDYTTDEGVNVYLVLLNFNVLLPMNLLEVCLRGFFSWCTIRPFGRPRHFTRVERAFVPFPETMATLVFLLLRSSLVIAFCLIFNDLIIYFFKPLIKLVCALFCKLLML
jgi:hypothetical protein